MSGHPKEWAMRPFRFRFSLWRLMIAVAITGAGIAFLRDFIPFLNAPVLAADPDGLLLKTSIRLAQTAPICGVTLWGLLKLWKFLQRRESLPDIPLEPSGEDWDAIPLPGVRRREPPPIPRV
jgi:hypothetical protein